MKFTYKDIGSDVIVEIGSVKEPGKIVVVGRITLAVHVCGHTIEVNFDDVTKVEAVHKFTQADIGRRVRVNDKGANDHGRTGVILEITSSWMYPIAVIMDDGDHCDFSNEEVTIDDAVSEACPECQGTGFVDLFTSTEPCSICKT